MSESDGKLISPFAIRAADALAAEVVTLVRSGKLDARCPAADALLEYALTRFGSHDPINDLVRHVEESGRPKV